MRIKFYENQHFRRQIFQILSILKPSLGSCEVPHKIWARLVQPFWRLLTQTNRQTLMQSLYVMQIKIKKNLLKTISGGAVLVGCIVARTIIERVYYTF